MNGVFFDYSGPLQPGNFPWGQLINASGPLAQRPPASPLLLGFTYFATDTGPGLTLATTSGTQVSSGTGTAYTSAQIGGTLYLCILVKGIPTWVQAAPGAIAAGPQPPTGVTATAGNGQVTLNWTNASGAAGVNIYYSTSNSGPWTLGFATNGTTGTIPCSWLIRGSAVVPAALVNGTLYYFALASYSSDGVVGPYGAVVSCTPNSYALWDRFTDANSTNLTAHTMDIGSGWTVGNGAFYIQSNACKQNGNTTNTSFNTLAYANAGKSDASPQVDVTAPGSGSFFPGVAGRVTDYQNAYVFVYGSGATTVYLQKYVSGVATTLNSTAFSWAAGATHTMQLVMSGTSLQGYIDGVLKVSATDSTYGSGKNNHGILSYQDPSFNSCTFDNFIVP